MALVSISSTLQHLPLILLLFVATGGSVTFNITNRCSYTVWPAAVPGGGVQLIPGQMWTLNVPAGTTGGRVWARTGCSFNSNGNGSCQTGDCGGMLACKAYGQPPNTIADFSLNGYNKQDFFDISLINGFNVPMDFLPVPAQGQGGQGCSRGPRCAANVTSECPSELKAPGGCNNACTVFKQDEYCCTGTAAYNCVPTNYSDFFDTMCPDACSYPEDDTGKTFTCPSGTSYQVVFCPPMDLAPSPAIPVKITPPPPSPIPAPIEQPTSVRSPARSRVIVILAPVAGFILLIMLFIIIFFVCKQRTRRHQEMEEEFGELQGTPMRFTFQQLKVATEQFRDKLGEGGFASVFEGRFGDERIAVKRLDHTGHGKKEFLAEVQTIGSIHHINLVRLIGFCAEKSHRLLVYEYMAKGSLDRWIYYRHDNDAAPLDWRTRYKIITHIAKGLSYLHEECTKRIAHLDVKPQNILLDDNFNAKLSDFGLCKLIDRDKSQVITRMRGTPGYLAPEWLTSQITEKADVYSFGVVVMEIISGRKNLDTSRSEESIHLITRMRGTPGYLAPEWLTSQITEKADVYSFGVVVIEIISGRKNLDTSRSEESIHLITLLEEKVKNHQLVDLIDRHSNDMQVHKQDIIQMMKLAMWCLQIDCKRRPEMSVVVKVLEGTMNAETNIDHSFVVRSPASFGVAGTVDSSAPPLVSDVSGPR